MSEKNTTNNSMGNCELREKETRVFIRAYSALEKKVRRVRPLVTRERDRRWTLDEL